VKVYLLTQGEYSDYRVVGIFSEAEPERAKSYAPRLDHGDIDGPWEVDGFTPENQPAGLICFGVRMYRDGNVNNCYEDNYINHEGKLPTSTYFLATHQSHPYNKNPWELHATVYAKDRSHAIKIVNELRTRILASPDQHAGETIAIRDIAVELDDASKP